MNWALAWKSEVWRCREACAPEAQKRWKVARRSRTSCWLACWNMSEAYSTLAILKSSIS